METLQCNNCCKDIPIDDLEVDTRENTICFRCYLDFHHLIPINIGEYLDDDANFVEEQTHEDH